ncbi:SDR family oxidoreductase [Mycobacterium sp. NAZ190054]|uniref:SDR family oxidoreductase n=1 Tax=Mycobacterium sp. NAZ190054 TaxID=1747766 RepID=UPI00079BBE3D|nr:SDR family oxidoreductase [Mycobacterium sp. NAZ190054]KWX65848.1 3-ketoacyl-ACP reductase [Mycobacterium sp. NAZ190054]
MSENSDHDPVRHPVMTRRSMLAAAAAVSAGAAGVAGFAAAQGGSPANSMSALVTGSSRGIGAATARRLARDGYALTVNCVVRRDLAADVVREIESAGGRAVWVQADVSDPAAVRRLFDEHERAFGRPDVVVANAGVMRLAPFAAMTDDDFDRMFAVNAKGSFNTLREAARRVRDGGRIVTLSSSITQLRSPTYGPYAATKMTQDMFASILAKELGDRRISVNAMAPGVVNTPLFTDGKTPEQIAGFVERTPHGRLGEPTDIADAIALLCGSGGGWVNGQTVFANGGIV